MPTTDLSRLYSLLLGRQIFTSKNPNVLRLLGMGSYAICCLYPVGHNFLAMRPGWVQLLEVHSYNPST